MMAAAELGPYMHVFLFAGLYANTYPPATMKGRADVFLAKVAGTKHSLFATSRKKHEP